MREQKRGRKTSLLRERRTNTMINKFAVVYYVVEKSPTFSSLQNKRVRRTLSRA
jgi:hypothetical protein